MTVGDMTQAISRHLFAEADAQVFAVLDGASVPNLLDKLSKLEPEHCCLYRGELEPDLAETAPYLVRLEQDSEFTKWVLAEGWGKHWGILAVANANLRTLRQHFRKFLMVYTEEGKPLYFRYYDPRVLRVYLPTCNEKETEIVFGPILRYYVEAHDPSSLIEYSHKDFHLGHRVSRLAAAHGQPNRPARK